MTDIGFADTPKLKMRLILWYAQHELNKQAKYYGLNIPEGKTVMEVIHDDLINSPNPVIRKLHDKIIEAASHMSEPYQKATMVDIGSFALWICYKDTAYNQPTYWILNELFKDDKLREELKYYVTEPENWYCARWSKTKQNTKKLQNEGKLSKYKLSKDEEIFVPALQQRKWYEIIKKDMDKQFKK